VGVGEKGEEGKKLERGRSLKRKDMKKEGCR